MEAAHRASAERVRSLIASSSAAPAVVRSALIDVPPKDRDAWLDWLLELTTVPEDGPELPRGCVPYLPCPVDAVLRALALAEVQATDVFVDVGSGVGRTAALVHLLTGAATIGIEIQPSLVHAARILAARINGLRFSPIEGDAAQLADCLTTASVFFLYCPFSGDRLARFLDGIEAVAETRQIRICAVDLPLPARAWLTLVSPPARDVAVYRSTHPMGHVVATPTASEH